ncbi:c-type cytochrome [Caldilinea sp.]|uniref:c-type cytochrome n=1 Tax=Caldilinea sp. TaxID=2293560 RepID=UPI002C1BB129|nr:c-type cytochrome [Caldilinea sp.]HRA66392.1 c-type cytochrome [Caldilinea sp.]
MFTCLSFHRTRRAVVALLIASLIGISLVVSLQTTPVSGQDQGVRESPPYDRAQVAVPANLPFAAAGRASYLENCAPCHGEQGLGDGPTVADLPSPPTAFADQAAMWELSPAMLFHTTKFGRLQKLMPPWSNQLTDDEIWNTVAFAWSLHTEEAATAAGALLYAESCAACHGDAGAGDGPEAEGNLNDFTDLADTTFASQADWLAGWNAAHPELGADWSQTQKEETLEYIRTFSYIPPWASAYRPGAGAITGQIVFGADAPQQVEGSNVFLDAYLGFDPVATFTATVGADNTFTFQELAVDPNLTYLVTVLAEGVSYSSGMVNLTPDQPVADTSIDVFGTTDSPGDLRINRVHWILDAQPGALVVLQIYLVGNTGERTFVGRSVDGVDVPVTVGIQLPPDAQELSFQNGALGDRFRQVGDVVYDTLPVTPGDSTQQIIAQYAIPYQGTSFDLKQTFDYPVDVLSLLVSNFPNLRVDVPAMTFDSIQNIQGTEYQVWGQEAFGPGEVEVKLQGLLERGAANPRSVGAATEGGASQLAAVAPPLETWVSYAMLAIVAAILLGLVGVAMQRGAFAAASSRHDLQSVRESLLTEVARIDDLHALGQMNDNEWLRRRAGLKSQLLDVVRRLDATGHAAGQT